MVLTKDQDATQVLVPYGNQLLTADVQRVGSDLVLRSDGSPTIVIRDFFNFPQPPDIVLNTGAVLKGEFAVKLAGPLAPGQLAQAGDDPATADTPSIGQVETVSGLVSVTRADGTQDSLSEGDAIYQGDVVATADDSSIGIRFADDSSFSLGESGRMVMDEMIYDPGAEQGSMGISLVSGAFSFISGQIAKTQPGAMTLDTPVATIGIRGTTLAGEINGEGQENTFSLIQDPDGTVGEVVFTNDAGSQVINVVGQTVAITSASVAPSEPTVLSADAIQARYGGVLEIVSQVHDAIVQQQGQADPDSPQGQQQDDLPFTSLDEAAQLINAAQQRGAQLAQLHAQKLELVNTKLDAILAPLARIDFAQFKAQQLQQLTQEIQVDYSASTAQITAIVQSISAAATQAGTAENSASAKSGALAASVVTKATASTVGMTSAQAQELASVVTAPMKALGAAGAISATASSLTKVALVLAAKAARGETIDPELLSRLDNAASELTASARKVDKVVKAAITAADKAVTQAITSAKSAKAAGQDVAAAAKTAAASTYKSEVANELLKDATDIDRLTLTKTVNGEVVVNMTDLLSTGADSGIQRIDDFIQADESFADIRTVVGHAKLAANYAAETAGHAENTMALGDPDQMVTYATMALKAANNAAASRQSADESIDLTALQVGLDASALDEFLSAIEFDSQAEIQATTATSGISNVTETIEAAADYVAGIEDPTNADSPQKILADTLAERDVAAAAVTDARQVAADAATVVTSRRSDLVDALVNDAVAQKRAEALRDAAELAEEAVEEAEDDVETAEQAQQVAAAAVTAAEQALAAAPGNALLAANLTLKQQLLANADAELAFANQVLGLYQDALTTADGRATDAEAEALLTASAAQDAQEDLDAAEDILDAAIADVVAALGAKSEIEAAVAEARAELSIAQAAAEAQAEASLDLVVEEAETLSNEAATSASEAKKYAEIAQANAILGSANKIDADAAEQLAIQWADAAQELAEQAEAALLDAKSAAALPYASQSAAAVAAREAATELAEAAAAAALQSAETAQAYASLATAASQLADLINPHFADPDAPTIAELQEHLSDASKNASDEQLEGNINSQNLLQKKNEADAQNSNQTGAAGQALIAATAEADAAEEAAASAAEQAALVAEYRSAIAEQLAIAEAADDGLDVTATVAQREAVADVVAAAAAEAQRLLALVDVAEALAVSAGEDAALRAQAAASFIAVGGNPVVAQVERATAAAAAAARSSGAAESAAENAAGDTDGTLAAAEIADAQVQAASLAEAAAIAASEAAASAAADARADAEQRAADKAAAEAVAADQAEALANQAVAKAAEAQQYAQAASVAAQNFDAVTAAEQASLAADAATAAQAAAESAAAIASGKGAVAVAQSERAANASISASEQSGAASATAEVAANQLAAAAEWTEGSASQDRVESRAAAQKAAAAASKAASAASAAAEAASQAEEDAVEPSVALAAAIAERDSRQQSLADVQAQRDLVDDGVDDATSETGLEAVWNAALVQAQKALTEATLAVTDAQAASDAAAEAEARAEATAETLAAAAASAAKIAAQAAQAASFAVTFEIEAQAAAQSLADARIAEVLGEIEAALSTAQTEAENAADALIDATDAAAAALADGASVELIAEAQQNAAAAQSAADAAADAALQAVLQAGIDLGLAANLATSAAAVRDFVVGTETTTGTADAAAAVDDISQVTRDIAPSTLIAAQNSADAAQLAAVASIKALLNSAIEAVSSASQSAAAAAAQSDLADAAADSAEVREQALLDAALAELSSVKQTAAASAQRAASEAAEAAAAASRAENRFADAEAAVAAANDAQDAADRAAAAAENAENQLAAAQDAYDLVADDAADTQATLNAALNAGLNSIDPKSYSSISNANLRAQSALAKAATAVSDAQAAFASASEAAAAAQAKSDAAAVAVENVDVANAETQAIAARQAADNADSLADTAAAAAASASALTVASGATSADVRALVTDAKEFAAGALSNANLASDESDDASEALSLSPATSAARSAAQSAADAAAAEAATAAGVAQVDTVTIAGDIEIGDSYTITVDGNDVVIEITTDNFDSFSSGPESPLALVRDELVRLINDDDTVGDIVASASGDGDGQISLTAINAGVPFSTQASASDGAGNANSATVATTTASLSGNTEVSQVDTLTISGAVEAGDSYTITVDDVSVEYEVTGDENGLAGLRSAIIDVLEDSAAFSAIVDVTAGAQAGEILLTAVTAGQPFESEALAENGGSDVNAAQITNTIANLRGADDIAAQAAQTAGEQVTTAANALQSSNAAVAQGNVSLQSYAYRQEARAAESTAEAQVSDNDADTPDATQSLDRAKLIATEAREAVTLYGSSQDALAELSQAASDLNFSLADGVEETAENYAALIKAAAESASDDAQSAVDAASVAITAVADSLGLTPGASVAATVSAINSFGAELSGSVNATTISKAYVTAAGKAIDDALVAYNSAVRLATEAETVSQNAQTQIDLLIGLGDIDAANEALIQAADERAEAAATSAAVARDDAIASSSEALLEAQTALQDAAAMLADLANFEATRGTGGTPSDAADEVAAASARAQLALTEVQNIIDGNSTQKGAELASELGEVIGTIDVALAVDSQLFGVSAIRSGLNVAADIASEIQEAVTDASTAANTARGNADALDPETIDDVATAEALADAAAAQVPTAQQAADIARAQAVTAVQASAEATAGRSQFEQALERAAEEAALALVKEAQNAVPVATDDVVSVNEDQSIGFNVLENDTRTDGTALRNPVLVAIGQAQKGTATIIRQTDTVTINGGFSVDEEVQLTVNAETFAYVVQAGDTASTVASELAALVSGSSLATHLTATASGDQLELRASEVGNVFNVSSDSQSVSVTSTGNVSYKPAGNYFGSDTFTYTVSNNSEVSETTDSAAVTVSVLPVNDAPDARNDFATVQESSTTGVTFSLKANDLDADITAANPDGDQLSVTAINGTVITPGVIKVVTLDSGATVTVNADGSVTYNPSGTDFDIARGQTQNDTFTYELSDAAGTTDTAVATVTVVGGNNAPVAQAQSLEVEEDDSVTGQLVATDADGDALQYSVAAGGAPTKGTLSLASDGSFVYTPNANFNGSDTFVYRVVDTLGVAAQDTVTIAVTAVNDAPVAGANQFSGLEDTTITGTLLATDADLADVGSTEALSFALETGGEPSFGDVTIDPDGTYTYTPNANYAGPDSFFFTVSDGEEIVSGQVSLTVKAVNDPLSAAPISVSGDEDTTIEGSLSAVDVDGSGTLTYKIAANGEPEFGSIVVDPDGSFAYTPNANFNGVDSFKFQAKNAVGETVSQTVTVTVNPVDDDAIAIDDEASAREGDLKALIDILGNDRDPDGDAIYVVAGSVVAASGAAITEGAAAVAQVSTVALSGAFSENDVLFFDVNGHEVSYTVQATDIDSLSTLASSVATALRENASIIEAVDIASTPQGELKLTSVTPGTAFDVGADILVTTSQTADIGVQTTKPNVIAGNVTYDLSAYRSLSVGQTTTDTITYQVSDNPNAQPGDPDTREATVNLTIYGSNENPVAVADGGYEATNGALLEVPAENGLIGNDQDFDEQDVLQAVATVVFSILGARVTINTDGSFTYNASTSTEILGGEVGQQFQDSFEYTVRDGNGGSATGTATLGVQVTDGPLEFSGVEILTFTPNFPDRFAGSEGDDTATMIGAAEAGDFINARGGKDRIILDDLGNDINISNAEFIVGGAGNDTIDIVETARATATGDSVSMTASLIGQETIIGTTSVGSGSIIDIYAFEPDIRTIDLGGGNDNITVNRSAAADGVATAATANVRAHLSNSLISVTGVDGDNSLDVNLAGTAAATAAQGSAYANVAVAGNKIGFGDLEVSAGSVTEDGGLLFSDALLRTALAERLDANIVDFTISEVELGHAHSAEMTENGGWLFDVNRAMSPYPSGGGEFFFGEGDGFFPGNGLDLDTVDLGLNVAIQRFAQETVTTTNVFTSTTTFQTFVTTISGSFITETFINTFTFATTNTFPTTVTYTTAVDNLLHVDSERTGGPGADTIDIDLDVFASADASDSARISTATISGNSVFVAAGEGANTVDVSMENRLSAIAAEGSATVRSNRNSDNVVHVSAGAGADEVDIDVQAVVSAIGRGSAFAEYGFSDNDIFIDPGVDSGANTVSVDVVVAATASATGTNGYARAEASISDNTIAIGSPVEVTKLAGTWDSSSGGSIVISAIDLLSALGASNDSISFLYYGSSPDQAYNYMSPGSDGNFRFEPSNETVGTIYIGDVYLSKGGYRDASLQLRYSADGSAASTYALVAREYEGGDGDDAISVDLSVDVHADGHVRARATTASISYNDITIAAGEGANTVDVTIAATAHAELSGTFAAPDVTKTTNVVDRIYLSARVSDVAVRDNLVDVAAGAGDDAVHIDLSVNESAVIDVVAATATEPGFEFRGTADATYAYLSDNAISVDVGDGINNVDVGLHANVSATNLQGEARASSTKNYDNVIDIRGGSGTDTVSVSLGSVLSAYAGSDAIADAEWSDNEIYIDPGLGTATNVIDIDVTISATASAADADGGAYASGGLEDNIVEVGTRVQTVRTTGTWDNTSAGTLAISAAELATALGVEEDVIERLRYGLNANSTSWLYPGPDGKFVFDVQGAESGTIYIPSLYLASKGYWESPSQIGFTADGTAASAYTILVDELIGGAGNDTISVDFSNAVNAAGGAYAYATDAYMYANEIRAAAGEGNDTVDVSIAATAQAFATPELSADTHTGSTAWLYASVSDAYVYNNQVDISAGAGNDDVLVDLSIDLLAVASIDSLPAAFAAREPAFSVYASAEAEYAYFYSNEISVDAGEGINTVDVNLLGRATAIAPGGDASASATENSYNVIDIRAGSGVDTVNVAMGSTLLAQGGDYVRAGASWDYNHISVDPGLGTGANAVDVDLTIDIVASATTATGNVYADADIDDNRVEVGTLAPVTKAAGTWDNSTSDIIVISAHEIAAIMGIENDFVTGLYAGLTPNGTSFVSPDQAGNFLFDTAGVDSGTIYIDYVQLLEGASNAEELIRVDFTADGSDASTYSVSRNEFQGGAGNDTISVDLGIDVALTGGARAQASYFELDDNEVVISAGEGTNTVDVGMGMNISVLASPSVATSTFEGLYVSASANASNVGASYNSVDISAGDGNDSVLVDLSLNATAIADIVQITSPSATEGDLLDESGSADARWLRLYDNEVAVDVGDGINTVDIDLLGNATAIAPDGQASASQTKNAYNNIDVAGGTGTDTINIGVGGVITAQGGSSAYAESSWRDNIVAVDPGLGDGVNTVDVDTTVSVDADAQDPDGQAYADAGLSSNVVVVATLGDVEKSAGTWNSADSTSIVISAEEIASAAGAPFGVVRSLYYGVNPADQAPLAADENGDFVFNTLGAENGVIYVSPVFAGHDVEENPYQLNLLVLEFDADGTAASPYTLLAKTFQGGAGDDVLSVDFSVAANAETGRDGGVNDANVRGNAALVAAGNGTNTIDVTFAAAANAVATATITTESVIGSGVQARADVWNASVTSNFARVSAGSGDDQILVDFSIDAAALAHTTLVPTASATGEIDIWVSDTANVTRAYFHDNDVEVQAGDGRNTIDVNMMATLSADAPQGLAAIGRASTYSSSSSASSTVNQYNSIDIGAGFGIDTIGVAVGSILSAQGGQEAQAQSGWNDNWISIDPGLGIGANAVDVDVYVAAAATASDREGEAQAGGVLYQNQIDIGSTVAVTKSTNNWHDTSTGTFTIAAAEIAQALGIDAGAINSLYYGPTHNFITSISPNIDGDLVLDTFGLNSGTLFITDLYTSQGHLSDPLRIEFTADVGDSLTYALVADELDGGDGDDNIAVDLSVAVEAQGGARASSNYAYVTDNKLDVAAGDGENTIDITIAAASTLNVASTLADALSQTAVAQLDNVSVSKNQVDISAGTGADIVLLDLTVAGAASVALPPSANEVEPLGAMASVSNANLRSNDIDIDVEGGANTVVVSMLGNLTANAPDGDAHASAVSNSLNVLEISGGDGADSVDVNIGHTVAVLGESRADAIAEWRSNDVHVAVDDGGDTIDIDMSVSVSAHSAEIAAATAEIRGNEMTVGASGSEVEVLLAGASLNGEGLIELTTDQILTAAGQATGQTVDYVRWGNAASDQILYPDGVSGNWLFDPQMVVGESRIHEISIFPNTVATEIPLAETPLTGGDGSDSISVALSIDAFAQGTDTLADGGITDNQVVVAAGDGNNTVTVDLQVSSLMSPAPLSATESAALAAATTAEASIRGNYIDVSGGTGIDTISINLSADGAVEGNHIIVHAGGGDDAVTATIDGDGMNIVEIYGGGGNDTLTGTDGGALLAGGDGNDQIFGGAGNDKLIGGSGDDIIHTGNNTGGDGDRIIGGLGNDTINFGTGLGWYALRYQNLAGPVAVDLSLGVNQVSKGVAGVDGVDSFVNIGAVEDGLSFLLTNGNDSFVGLSIADSWVQIDGGAGNDSITGGIGIERLVYSNATSGIVLNLGSVDVDMAPLVNVASFNLLGDNTAAAFSVRDGLGGVDDVSGGGIEEVRGSSFADIMIGDGGDNTFITDGGDDYIDGGGGIDVVRYNRTGIEGGVNADLEAGTAFGNWLGTAFSQILTGIERLIGSGGDDGLFASNTLDSHLEGRGGNDTLTGRDSNDVLLGGEGDDILFGGAGNDYLDGGSGADDLIGGAGDDTLLFDSTDALVDGGDGDDTLVFDEATTEVDLRGNTAAKHIEHAELGIGSKAITLSFNAADVASLTDENNTFTIFGDADDRVVSDGIWRQVGTAGGFSQFTSGATLLQVQDGIDLTGFGLVTTDFVGTLLNDTHVGTTGNDTYFATAGNDTFAGSGGTDQVIVSTDFVFDGVIFDGSTLTINYEDRYAFSQHSLTVQSFATNPLAQLQIDIDNDGLLDTLVIETSNLDLNGVGSTNNLVIGSAVGETISGGATTGVDILIGGGGDDTITATSLGTTYMDGGLGDDTLIGSAGVGRFFASQGNDVYDLGAGGSYSLQVGFDWFVTSAYRKVSDLSNDVLLQFEDDSLTAHSMLIRDNIDGNNLSMTFVDLSNPEGMEKQYLLAASNSASGFEESAYVIGNDDALADDVTGSNNDDIVVGDGSGGAIAALGGDDLLIVTTMSVTDAALEIVDGGAGRDTVTFEHIDTVTGVLIDLDALGSDGNGTADEAGGSRNLIGVENVVGSHANDTIEGDGLDNMLDGSDGDDVLIGGGGVDFLIGGAGEDTFKYLLDMDSNATDGMDVIRDFDADDSDGVSDFFDISALLENGLALSFDFVTEFSGGGDFVAEARLVDSGIANSKILEIDSDADGAANVSVELENVDAAALGANDFHTGLNQIL